MGYYAGPFRPGDPPGVPLFGAFQTIKHLHDIIHVPIFATKIRFYTFLNQLFINHLNRFYYG